MKELLGHDGPPTGLWDKNLITDTPLDRCPLRTLQLAPRALDAELHRYTETYYPAYEAGHLLVQGGLGDQPARYTELIQLVGTMKKQTQAKFDEMTEEDES